MVEKFRNREEAGALLAQRLQEFDLTNAIVFALPRGGVPVGAAIAKRLNLPLDVLIVKKIGFPGDPELAIGAAGEKEYELSTLAREVPKQYLTEQISNLQKEIKERTRLLRGNKPAQKVEGKIAIIVDDGAATGATMILAAHMIRKQNPKQIIIAIPVGPLETIPQLENVAEEVICLETPRIFGAVGQFYEDFHEIDDKTAQELLR